MINQNSINVFSTNSRIDLTTKGEYRVSLYMWTYVTNLSKQCKAQYKKIICKINWNKRSLSSSEGRNKKFSKFTSWKQKGIAKTLTPMMQLIKLNITGVVLIGEIPDRRKNSTGLIYKSFKSSDPFYRRWYSTLTTHANEAWLLRLKLLPGNTLPYMVNYHNENEVIQ